MAEDDLPDTGLVYSLKEVLRLVPKFVRAANLHPDLLDAKYWELLRSREAIIRHNEYRWTLLMEEHRYDLHVDAHLRPIYEYVIYRLSIWDSAFLQSRRNLPWHNRVLSPRVVMNLLEQLFMSRFTSFTFITRFLFRLLGPGIYIRLRSIHTWCRKRSSWFLFTDFFLWSSVDVLDVFIDHTESLPEFLRDQKNTVQLAVKSATLPSAPANSSEWYDALYDADCKKVTQLLKNDRKLLKQGWRKDSEERIAGHAWEGRTALHVAARRGCSKLVELVMFMMAEEERDSSIKDETNPEAGSSSTTDHIVASELGPSINDGIHTVARSSTNLLMSVSVTSNSLVKEPAQDKGPEFTLLGLLKEVDGFLGLDALAMAIINGNQDIIDFLTFKTKPKPSLTMDEKEPGAIGDDKEPGVIEGELQDLTNKFASHVMRNLSLIDEEEACKQKDGEGAQVPKYGEGPQVPKYGEGAQVPKYGEGAQVPKYGEEAKHAITQIYFADVNFNFLPVEQYFFHFYFYAHDRQSWRPEWPLELAIERALKECTPEILRFRVELPDVQGRTPLHAAIDSDNAYLFSRIFLWDPKLPDEFLYNCWNARDAAGRTPLYRAAATDKSNSLRVLVAEQSTDLNATYCPPPHRWGRDFDLNKVSKRNAYKGVLWEAVTQSTALHIAIIRSNSSTVAMLLQSDDKRRPKGCILNMNVPFICFAAKESKFYRFNPLQLAVLVGDTTVLQQLIQDPRVMACDKWSASSTGHTRLGIDGWRAFHLAAAVGDPKIVKLFVDLVPHPLLEDEAGNTALHYAFRAMETKVAIYSHLTDCVSCTSDNVSRSRFQVDVENVIGAYDHPRECVNLLLQSGIKIRQPNHNKFPPRPGPDAPRMFLSWWYDMVAKETLEEQTKLNGAANAISVTATLVATASYVGPLQPPLGYGGNLDDYSSQVQVHFILVKAFIVCDTLSFYLAVAAIILALIPSLPTPSESRIRDVENTRMTVTWALGLLVPSIISILVAFAAASIVVIRDQNSWDYGGLTVSTAAIGGFICLIVILVFLLTFLKSTSRRRLKSFLYSTWSNMPCNFFLGTRTRWYSWWG